MIDHNDLVELAPYTFSNLANLSMVNLTYNKLTKFPLNALTLDTSKPLSSTGTETEPINIDGKYKVTFAHKKLYEMLDWFKNKKILCIIVFDYI